MTRLKTLDTWLSRTFRSFKTDSAKVAVAITEGLQTSIRLGTLSTIAHTVSWIMPRAGKLPPAVIEQLEKAFQSILAIELGIEGPRDHSSEEEFQDFGDRVMMAFNTRDDNSKLWTTLAAQIYNVIKRHVGQPAIAFSQSVSDVEKAYQDLKADQAAELNEKIAIVPFPIVAC
jgi:hypothetical protein